MSETQRESRILIAGLVLGALAIAGSTYVILTGYRPLHVWGTLVGSLASMYAIWSVRRANRRSG